MPTDTPTLNPLSPRKRLLATLLPLALSACAPTPKSSATAPTLPHLQHSPHLTQLSVNNHPFLALGGELGNSDASDLHVLRDALARCRRMRLNTVMLPVYWDLLEPQEGHFDFSLVKGAIDEARRQHLHLVYLWFGTWKNSMSCYAPSWVKRDTARFPRAQRANGETLEIISAESQAACDADARAFAALMRWTRDYDVPHHTVLMVQVENEIGMIPDPRDHSPLADAAYHRPVPQQLLTLLTHNQLGPEIAALWQNAGHKTEGAWPEVFGPSPAGQELFSAWTFATYTQHVAAAGKHAYPLPMYANAALIRPHYLPGQYPAGGPLPHLLELWRAAAPALDMISPDIYFPNFAEWCERYSRNGNPLFIPEMAPSARAPANILYAIARFHAIGCGPFSIENVSPDKERQIAACYQMLDSLAPLILQGQRNNTIAGLSPRINFDWSTSDQPEQCTLAGITFEARFDHPAAAPGTTTTTLPTLGSGRWDAPPDTPRGAAMILKLAPDQFLIAGMGATITFSPADRHGHIGIDTAQEGRYLPNGVWQGARWLNGDETHQGRHIHLPDNTWTLQRVTFYHY